MIANEVLKALETLIIVLGIRKEDIHERLNA